MNGTIRSIALVILVFGLIVLTSCAGTEEAESNSANNTLVVIPEADNSKTPISANSNTKLVPYNGNENIEGNPTLDNSKVTVIDTSKLKPTIKGVPMPENSEMMTVMNAKGQVIETRAFKDNPYILKIERLTVTPKDISAKVYLRNGSVKDLPIDELKDLKSISTSRVLEIIGFKYPDKGVQNGKSKEEIQKERGSKKPR